MSKKQRARKEQKLAQKPRGNAPPSWFTSEISPQARRVMEELAQSDAKRSEADVLRALIDSAELREEPELQAFEFGVEQVERIVTRLLPKYSPKLESAKAIGDEELQTVYDDLRIEALESLLTREKRQEFLRGYDGMLKRLLAGTDVSKIKLALVVRSMLDQKEIPWGIIALVTDYFEDAKSQALERYQVAEGVFTKMLKLAGADVNEKDLIELLQDPERMGQVAQALNMTPEQQAQMRELSEGLLKEFESEVFSGNVELTLFTEAEMEETAARLNTFTDTLNAGDREPNAQDMQTMAGIFQDYIAELMTPERIKTMQEDLAEIANDWLKEGYTEAALLRIESEGLNQSIPRENPFLYAVLIGQLRANQDLDDDMEPEMQSEMIEGEIAKGEEI